MRLLKALKPLPELEDLFELLEVLLLYPDVVCDGLCPLPLPPPPSMLSDLVALMQLGNLIELPVPWLRLFCFVEATAPAPATEPAPAFDEVEAGVAASVSQSSGEDCEDIVQLAVENLLELLLLCSPAPFPVPPPAASRVGLQLPDSACCPVA